MPVSRRGTASTASRRARASGSRASRRARPTCPCDGGGRPGRERRVGAVALGPAWSAIDSALGVRRVTTRQRDRMVTDTSSGWVDGVQSRKTVRGDGSSTALSSALLGLLGEPVGVLDEHHLPAAAGRGAGRAQHQGAHLVDRDRQTLRDDRRGRRRGYRRGWCGTRRTRRSRPVAHCSAAANARAATDRPGAGRPGEQPGVGHRAGRDRRRRARPAAAARGRASARLDRRRPGRPGRRRPGAAIRVRLSTDSQPAVTLRTSTRP